MIVYSKKQCPACDEAKALLTLKGIPHKVFVLDVDYTIDTLFGIADCLGVAPPRSFPMIVDGAFVMNLTQLKTKLEEN